MMGLPYTCLEFHHCDFWCLRSHILWCSSCREKEMTSIQRHMKRRKRMVKKVGFRPRVHYLMLNLIQMMKTGIQMN